MDGVEQRQGMGGQRGESIIARRTPGFQLILQHPSLQTEPSRSRPRADKEYRSDRVDRLRNGAAAPSPLKQRKSGVSGLPNASNQAIVGVSAPSPLPTSRRQSAQGHPFASGTPGTGTGGGLGIGGGAGDVAYDASNVAVPSQAGLTPIAPMNINGRSGGGGGTTANSQNQQVQQGEADFGERKKQGGFMRFITCGCFR